MHEKIRCPHCSKINESNNKFCIYCGNKLENNNPDATCLNCGRVVEEGQSKCECGYEFRDIKCPECQTENAYTNKFCTNCGKQLWRSYVFEYNYFKNGLKDKKFPKDLRYISVYNRLYELQNEKPDADSVEELKNEKNIIKKNIDEIILRWKIIAPNYCIECLNLVNPNEYKCGRCGTFLMNKKRLDYFKNEKNIYIKPEFDYKSLKCTSKTSDNYLNSLAPSIGESQFEYQERLKIEYAENIRLFYRAIDEKIKRLKAEELLKRRPVTSTRSYNSTRMKEEYCNNTCKYHDEHYLDEHGGITAYIDTGNVLYYCELKRKYVTHGVFCENYEK